MTVYPTCLNAVIVYSKYDLGLIKVRINSCLHGIILFEIWSLLGEYWKTAAHVKNCHLYPLDSLFAICQWKKKAGEEDEEETVTMYTIVHYVEISMSHKVLH